MRRPGQPSSRRCNGKITLPQGNLAQRQLITLVMNYIWRTRRTQRQHKGGENTEQQRRKARHPVAPNNSTLRRCGLIRDGLSAILHPTLVRFGNYGFKCYDGSEPWHDCHLQFMIVSLCSSILQLKQFSLLLLIANSQWPSCLVFDFFLKICDGTPLNPWS